MNAQDRLGGWPVVPAGKPVQCIAMFVDIRGSSAEGLQPGSGFGFEARLTSDFTKETRKFWTRSDAPQPDTVRISGDGIFCTWGFPARFIPAEFQVEREKILRAALGLLSHLESRLHALGNPKDGIRFGIGLSHGPAYSATIDTPSGKVVDYYGKDVNLASKLQNLARPSGLLTTTQFVSADVASDLKLVERRFEHPFDKGDLICWATPQVRRVVNWTCLAWPGFAGGASAPNAEKMSLNLNGITVLTHEGLQGKIETLQIWPRNDFREKGDCFEVIIDDFDGITGLHDSGEIHLFSHPKSAVRKVVTDLTEVTEICEFYFKPIRCGLNALAFHIDVAEEVSRCQSYREVLELTRGRRDIKLSLYDNMGASLPVILNGFHPELTSKQFWRTGSVLWNPILEKLQEIQNQCDGPLFKLEASIEDMATHIQRGRSSNVGVGGGAWLGNPLRIDENDHGIRISIPRNSKGFVWMEGAAVINNQSRLTHLENLRQDLRETVLRDDYQLGLVEGLSYGTVPVTTAALAKLLGGRGDEIIAKGSAAGLTVQEARLMFEDVGTPANPRIRLRPNLWIRQRPDKSVSRDWETAWLRIKQELCE